MIDKGVCNKGFIWSPSNCECECNEYLDYSNCKCRKKLVDPLAEECTECIAVTKLVEKTLDKNEAILVKKTLDQNRYRVLFWIFFILFLISIGIGIGIGINFVYCKYVNRNKYDLPY